MPDLLKLTLILILAAAIPFAAAADSDELPLGVQSVLKLRQVPQDTLSVHVEDVETGEVVLEYMAATPRNPASTMKLLTTLVALDTLGPAYRWKTDV